LDDNDNDIFLGKMMRILRDRFVQQFGSRVPLVRFVVVPVNSTSFGPNIFLQTDQQAQEIAGSALGAEMVEFIFQELLSLGFGPRLALDVEVRFRSREEVNRKFGGDYYRSMQ